MTYLEQIYIPKKRADFINDCLNDKRLLNPDETITETAEFINGFKMEVRCCGAPVEEGGCWTEAVLLNTKGKQVKKTDICEDFIGTWELTYRKEVYQVTIKVTD